MKTNQLANRNAIRGDRQPIKNENNAAERKGLNANNDAANALKQTINDAFTDSNNQTAVKMTEKEREAQELQKTVIKPPIKRPFTFALIDKNSKNPLTSSIHSLGKTSSLGATNPIKRFNQS